MSVYDVPKAHGTLTVCEEGPVLFGGIRNPL